MEDTIGSAHDQFFHIRMIVGIVVGLSVARLLTGLAQFVQHPLRERIYPVHLGWVIFLLLGITHFWWFEFGLSRLERWSFEIYFFVLFYAALFFFICTILFPDRKDEYSGFEQYFHSRQKWFYGLLALLFLVDIVDTLIKGAEHFNAVGVDYPYRQVVLAALSMGAIFVADRRYHIAFVIVALGAQLWWIALDFYLY